MKYRRMAVLAAGTIVALVAVGISLYAKEARPVEPGGALFAANLVLVETRDGRMAPLRDARVVVLADRHYMTGKVLRFADPTVDDMTAGSTSWIPLGDVTRFSEYVNDDQLVLALRAGKSLKR
jgi:hypothetical protein